MVLDHERLDVYRLALDFLVFAHQVIETLPRGRSHLCDQLTRASISIVSNLAEGAGRHSKADKRRYYVSARGSATESAALLDVLSRLALLDEAAHKTGKEMLVRVGKFPANWPPPDRVRARARGHAYVPDQKLGTHRSARRGALHMPSRCAP